jgi:hypothetical protein
MKCTVHIYLLNALYSQRLADDLYEGKESADNRKHQWEDELHITSDVEKINVLRDVSFPLQGQMPDGTDFSHDLTKMMLFEIESSDAPKAYIGASESIVNRQIIEEAEGAITIKLYLNDDEPYANPYPGLFVASKEFPKALIF